MTKEQFETILDQMNEICKNVNEQMDKNPENSLRYEVLQYSDIANRYDIVQQITDFYNRNWTGNKDFMHIPDFNQVLYNCSNYPIIIAREKGKSDILAISTIKYAENKDEEIDPYFPEKDAKYFSITGILTKKETKHRGMGKKIYEIALRGAYEFNKKYPGTRAMCVIDCRNKNSLRALAKAVENINETTFNGKNKELPAEIVGYYELVNNEMNPIEAPTLVLVVGLVEQPIMDKDELEIVYDKP